MAESVSFKIYYNWLLDKWGFHVTQALQVTAGLQAHTSGTKSYSKLDTIKVTPSKAEKPCREILTNWRAEKTPSYVRGCLGSISGKSSSLRWWLGTRTGSPGNGHSTKQEFKKCLDNALRCMVWFLVLSCAGPGVEFNAPCGSLSTQDNV